VLAKKGRKMDDANFRVAAERLGNLRRSLDAYNSFAMEHGLYVIGINPLAATCQDLEAAESFVPREILDDVYKSKR